MADCGSLRMLTGSCWSDGDHSNEYHFLRVSGISASVPRIVTAAFTSAIPKNAPGEIVYIPVGSNKINATVGGKPGEITVNVPAERGQAIAASLQSALEKRLAGTVRPRLAFDHAKGGPASGHPKSFSFDPARGIILATDWSNSGKAAIEGGDYGYFSPTFYIDDAGVPNGLPEKGEIGSLVDEPAFRNIGLIAASEAYLHEENQPSHPAMSKLIFAALAISAAAENAEAEAVDLIKNLKVKAADADRLKTENDDLKKKVEAAAAAAAAARKQRADTLVKAAVADGRILVKDTEKQDKFREKIEAGDTFAEEILAQLPKQNEGLGKSIVVAGADKSAAATGFEAKARALVTAGEAKTLDDAIGLVAASDPTAYTEYLATLS
jgi:phage I-like protein